ncbi:NADH-quinone oxidoreductase subunit NuoN [Helicobacter sp. 11S02629-2]|uniref:NADH-quinone oxidoreductase subunit NuoN n=1 Tax=Helicobacter sp. 11S02629-2 TaxID=1476195 RepID=UPI000BA75D85|nr:NADH-quinone oxidoreductase subunit NuoN [Helicobacter sp. 11S02629-2]PAF44991.1 hypothetical protein BKH40_04365 [Helicobacter sp. 11S02629-2]
MQISQILDSSISFIPSLIAVLGGIVILIANAFTTSFSRSLNVALGMLFLIINLAFTLSAGYVGKIDVLTITSQGIILAASIIFMLLIISKKRFAEFQTPEFYTLYLIMIAGFEIMVTSSNLIVIFIGLEIASLPLASIIALNKERYGLEGGIKYFVMGAYASVFYILGAMFIYMFTGSLDMQTVFQHLMQIGRPVDASLIALPILGVIFMIGAIGFKISLVPWHSWMPDVYEGSNPVIAGFISIVPKIAGFMLAFRILIPLSSYIDYVTNTNIMNILFYVLIVFTMSVPNLLALLQKDVKRMLAFSSISHSGYALACVYLNAFAPLFMYWILFLITNVGAFALLWVCKNKKHFWNERYDHPYEKFQGLVRFHPVMAMLFAIFMLSLAGVPPFAVFWGKILVVMTALSEGHIWLSIIMMLNSAVAVYYYLRLIVYMFFKKPVVSDGSVYLENQNLAIEIVIGVAALLCVFAIFVVAFFSNYVPVFAHLI